LQEVDNGDVLQCYNSPDDRTLNFCELEAHAPAARLAPGAEQSSEVEVILFKDGIERISSLARRFVHSRVHSTGLFKD
jgi:hypothetical protein